MKVTEEMIQAGVDGLENARECCDILGWSLSDREMVKAIIERALEAQTGGVVTPSTNQTLTR